MEKIRKDAHIWARDEYDWYVEPHECSRAFFQHEPISGTVWDPACGFGRIVGQASSLNLASVGTDVVRRSELCSQVFDFFSPEAMSFSNEHEDINIVTNPPFGRAEDFVRRALEIVKPGYKVAAVLPIVWLAGFSTKRAWLPRSPLLRVFPISPRPSMPPGRAILEGQRPGNGTKDYCWLVWEVGYTGNPEVRFLNTSRAKKEVLGLI